MKLLKRWLPTLRLHFLVTGFTLARRYKSRCATESISFSLLQLGLLTSYAKLSLTRFAQWRWFPVGEASELSLGIADL